jgi:hypothetical protein
MGLTIGTVVAGPAGTVQATETTVFAGCVVERTDTSITLSTSGDGRIVIDTTWLKPTMRDSLASECLTVSTLEVEGRHVAESVESGDEPNEVNSVTRETTANR